MKIHPASFYRDASRNYLIDFSMVSSSKIRLSNDLRADLEKAYIEAQILVQDAISSQQKTMLESHLVGKGLIAMGLFAFGDLDKYTDILDAVEIVSNDKRAYKIYSLLANSMTAMLPLPPDVRPKENVNAVRKWLEEHQERLQWDEISGMYIWPSP